MSDNRYEVEYVCMHDMHSVKKIIFQANVVLFSLLLLDTHSIVFNHGEMIYKIKSRLSDSPEACLIIVIKLNMLNCIQKINSFKEFFFFLKTHTRLCRIT